MNITYLYQDGPLPIVNGVITPISTVITPVTHLFSAIYRGPISPHLQLDPGPILYDELMWFLRDSKISTRPSTTLLFESLSSLVVDVHWEIWCVVGQKEAYNRYLFRRKSRKQDAVGVPIYVHIVKKPYSQIVPFWKSTCRMYMHFVGANRGCVGCVFEGSRNLLTFGDFFPEVVLVKVPFQ